MSRRTIPIFLDLFVQYSGLHTVRQTVGDESLAGLDGGR
jgi:hypothetical protein